MLASKAENGDESEHSHDQREPNGSQVNGVNGNNHSGAGAQNENTSPPNTSSPLARLAARARSQSLAAPRSTAQVAAAFFRTRSRDSAARASTLASDGTNVANTSSATPPSPRGRSRRNLIGLLIPGVGLSSPSEASTSSHIPSTPPVPPVPPPLSAPPRLSAPPPLSAPPAPQPATPTSKNALKSRRTSPIQPSSPHTTMRHPTPHPSCRNYPNYTPAAGDWRWYKEGEDNDVTMGLAADDKRVWVGPTMLVISCHVHLYILTELGTFPQRRIVAQLYPTHDPSVADTSPQEFEHSILQGRTQGRWASFGWADLWTAAPWLQERITKRIDGEGLGIE